ncbi:MAG TPA: RNA 2',3'-cyclic phosphodiesterase [Thermoanaerobaculia bacterium]|nr:RNA 2',3'-cyclic phosphodiesterase [Thermoanaerobaculia bacterium]
MNGGTARLFVAIDPPEEVRAATAKVCRGLEGARWTRPEQLHVTLRFAGSIPGAAVPDLAAALRGVRLAPFDVAAGGFGVFPPRGAPRVLWTALTPAAPLVAAHDAVEAGVRGLLPPDEKRFSPHLTLARLERARAGDVRAWIADREPFSAGAWTVEAFALYSSTLTSSGAIHRRIESYPLAPAVPAGRSSE